MRIIIDTDILSMFAKVGAVDVLGEFLGRERVAMMMGGGGPSVVAVKRKGGR